MTTEEKAAAWEVMKEVSTIIYPLKSTFYSSARVVFVDRFGIRWGIMTESTECKKLKQKEEKILCQICSKSIKIIQTYMMN